MRSLKSKLYLGLFVLPLLGWVVLSRPLVAEEQTGELTPGQVLEVVRRFCLDPKLQWSRERGSPYWLQCGEDKRAEVNPKTGQVEVYRDRAVNRTSTKVRLTMGEAYRLFVNSLPRRGGRLPAGMRLTRARTWDARGFHYQFDWSAFRRDLQHPSWVSAYVSASTADVSHYQAHSEAVEVDDLTPKLSREEAIRLAEARCPLEPGWRTEEVHLAVRREIGKLPDTIGGPMPPPGKQVLTWAVTLRGNYIYPPKRLYGPEIKRSLMDCRAAFWINAADGKLVCQLLEPAKDNDLEAVARLQKIPLPVK